MSSGTASSRHVRVLSLAMACGVACTSCAATNRIAMPAAYVAEQASGWPPVTVDGYTTRDGTRHRIYGGRMIAHGDSVTFIATGASYGERLRSPRPATRTLHRDSVYSVEARVPDEHAADLATAVGGAVIGVMLAMLLFYGAFLPWAFH